MNWATEPVELTSDRLTVRTMRPQDIEGITAAIHDPTGWSGRIWGIDTPEKIRAALRTRLESHGKGTANPFVYFVKDEVAGVTMFHGITAARKAFELGWTCVAPKWRRTFVNTEVKSLLLGHAFERLGAVRVEQRVDCHNFTSQMNVLRLGAVFEGKIRNWQIRHTGEVPDGRLYSFTNEEWPEVRARFDALRAGLPPPVKFLPFEFGTPRLKMRVQKLSEAGALLEFAKRNLKNLTPSFPKTAAISSVWDAQSLIAERAHWAYAGTAFYFGVWDKEPAPGDAAAAKGLVGQLHIKNINWSARSAELGYIVDSERRRQGLATEMVQVILAELFSRFGFRRVSLRVLATNPVGLEFARNLGFTQEGVLRSEFLNGAGDLEDVVSFSRVGSEKP